jgi:hypothetical protein
VKSHSGGSGFRQQKIEELAEHVLKVFALFN